MVQSATFLSAGIDWFTGTAKSPDAVERIRGFALSLAEIQMADGFFGKPWRQSGYEGFAVGHVQYGERHDGCCIRLGSHVAAAHWHRCYELCENVTRLDVQSTWRMSSDCGPIIQKHYAQMLRHSKRFRKAPALSMLCDSQGGRTVYSGRRASESFGRIYDKGRESKQSQFDRCLRYEVEFKGDRCKSLALNIQRQANAWSSLADITLRFFRRRGCLLEPLYKSLGSFTFVNDAGFRPGPTDVEKSLRWLAVSVGPTVRRLQKYYTIANLSATLQLSQEEPVD